MSLFYEKYFFIQNGFENQLPRHIIFFRSPKNFMSYKIDSESRAAFIFDNEKIL